MFDPFDEREPQAIPDPHSGQTAGTSQRESSPSYSTVRIISSFDKDVGRRSQSLVAISAAANKDYVLCWCSLCSKKSLHKRLLVRRQEARCECRPAAYQPDRAYVERREANTAIRKEIEAPQREQVEREAELKRRADEVERKNAEVRKRQEQFLRSL